MTTLRGTWAKWVLGCMLAWTISSSASAQGGSWYRLNYVVGTTVHDALLIMSGNDGFMFVRYFDRRTRATKTVRMDMQRRNTAVGLALMGSNVVDASTGRAVTTYAPDNLIARTAPDGSESMYVVDAWNNLALVSIRELTRSADQTQSKREFRLQ